MPVRYTEDEWELMRHCFAVLRVAFVELQTVFAETGSVDFIEVAQIALRILEFAQEAVLEDIHFRNRILAPFVRGLVAYVANLQNSGAG